MGITGDIANIKYPILIGIAGDSGSGKTTFSNGIRELIGSNLVKTIEADGYHKENRQQRKISGKLPLDPEANYLNLLLKHMQMLKEGKTISVPRYNHTTGDFDTAVQFSPSPIVIIEGLHVLYPQFLPYLDFTLYVDPSRDIKWQWKMKRDTGDRGHTNAELKKEILQREAAYKRFIDFQKTSATIVVKIFPSQIKNLARYEFIGKLETNCYKYELMLEPSQNMLPSLILPFDLAKITEIETPPFLLASIPGKYWGRDIATIHIDGELFVETVAALSKHIENYTGKSLKVSTYLHAVSSTRFTQLIIAWRFLELISFKIAHENG